jgi:pilus assembly protein Flp/PilA
MRSFIQFVSSYGPRYRHADDRRGQTLVEYGLILALIAVIVILGLLILGPLLGHVFTGVSNNLNGLQPSPIQIFTPSPSPS